MTDDMHVFDDVADPQLQALLMQGSVGVLPTDTIFGIVARAVDPSAVARLYHAKGREGKPGTIIAASEQQLIDLGLEPVHVASVAHLWPNPISIVLPATGHLTYLHQGKDSLAVRIPRDTAVRALLETVGPLLTSSANQPGEAPATTLDEALSHFGSSIDFYVHGSVEGRAASTVGRLLPDGMIETLRLGDTPIA